jgi:deferrochelatase/peroxidase EfeB
MSSVGARLPGGNMSSAGIAVEMENVQGLVVRPYRYKFARHALFSFGGPAEARRFLAALIPQVTTGATPVDGNVPVFYNIALTYSGLAHLGQPAEFLSQLDPMLAEGPDPITLGDISTSTSDPASWWERRFTTDQVHCMVQLFARELAAFQQGIATLSHVVQQDGLTELIPRQDGTRLDGTSIPGGRVHFGYKDGISQPDVGWDEARLTQGQLHFRNFVVGYATDDVYSSPGRGAVAETLRDSSYLVLRWIYQDVAAFNRYLDAQGPLLAPHVPLDQARELVAAKLVGRWRDGTPLVLSADGPSDAVVNSSAFRLPRKIRTG